MLAARWIKMRPRHEDAAGHVVAEKTSRDARLFSALDSGYTSILSWSLAHRGIVAGIAVLVLLSSVPLFMIANKNFLPNDDQAEFEVGVRAPEGTSLEATDMKTGARRNQAARRRRYRSSRSQTIRQAQNSATDVSPPEAGQERDVTSSS